MYPKYLSFKHNNQNYGYKYNEVRCMDKKDKKKELTEQEQQAKDYCEMIEAKLRKAEKRTWMIKDYDYLDN